MYTCDCLTLYPNGNLLHGPSRPLPVPSPPTPDRGSLPTGTGTVPSRVLLRVVCAKDIG
jgi:hypothetical protein